MADAPLVIANHRAGAFYPMQIFNHRGGLFREAFIYLLPADLGTPPTNGTGTLTVTFAGHGSGTEVVTTGFGSGVGTFTFAGSGSGTTKSAATTVIFISDLLEGAEVLGTSNDTVVLQACITRLIKRTGIASTANITTQHVTVDFEDTYWMSEDPLTFPRDSDLASIHHVCERWPKGMTWRNGGIQADTDDGTLPELIRPDTGKARDRFHLQFQQNVQRPNATDQWLTFENFWVKGPHGFPGRDYDVDYEGQEAFKMQGTQWVRWIDTKIDDIWADAIYTSPHPSTVTGRDNDVYPGMLEILGGEWNRLGIMHVTLNQCRAPDAVITPGFWKNDPDHVIVPDSMNDAPSFSGTQWGLWWHANADHPFVSTNGTRSIVDIEPIGSYSHVQDIRIGADSNKQHFRFLYPDTGGSSNFISAGDGWQILRRFEINHVYRDGDSRVLFGGSPAGVVSPTSQAATVIAAGSDGDVLPETTINVNNAASFPTVGKIVVRVAFGWTLVNYTGKTSTSFTGCTNGAGTLNTGSIVRNATPQDGVRVAAGSDGVLLGAKNSLVGGDGILDVSGTGVMPTNGNARVWTDTGVFHIGWTGKTSTTLLQTKVLDNDPAVEGAELRTGQAVTVAFDSPERLPYCHKNLTVNDFQWTRARGGEIIGAAHCDGLTVTNCTGVYRNTQTPLNLNDVLHVTQSGNRFTQI